MNHMSFAEAINLGIRISMEQFPDLVCFGIGVNDPKRIFSTTQGLVEEFGLDRVFETPTSENALTGIQVGLAIDGVPSIVTHQRFDFFLLAMDQLVNSAAKWHFMFGSQVAVPIVIRLIVGKGWGQGPTHSQSFHSWLLNVPGLKVLVPSNPSDAKDSIIEAVREPNPVIILEHRWLHDTFGPVSRDQVREVFGKARIIVSGKKITVIASSYLVPRIKILNQELLRHGVDIELIDLVSLSPIDWQTIFTSVEKTGRLIVFDFGHTTGSIASEIVAKVSMNHAQNFKSNPKIVAAPDIPEGTSYAITKELYINDYQIVREIMVAACMQGAIEQINVVSLEHHDVSSDRFKGPF